MGSRQKRVMDKVEVESEDMLLSCPLLKATVLFTL